MEPSEDHSPVPVGANEGSVVPRRPAVPPPVGIVIEPEGSFLAAIGAGFGAALVGAVLWAGITVATGVQIGFMAVGVGFLVGLAIRNVGRGRSPKFAVAGATLALIGCVLGNLFTVLGLIANDREVRFFDLLGHALANPGTAAGLMSDSFQVMDLLFYGIAIYEGFKLSRVPRTA